MKNLGLSRKPYLTTAVVYSCALMTQILRRAAAAAVLALCAAPAAAQSTETWHWMSDGVVFANFNHQSSDRGDTQFRSQNWIMGSGSHKLGKGQLFVSGMVSLEPVSVGARGYAELFQMGEAYQQLENID